MHCTGLWHVLRTGLPTACAGNGIPPHYPFHLFGEVCVLPKEISYGILHDVALGRVLPGQTFSTSNSSQPLLTSNMNAKLSDLE